MKLYDTVRNLLRFYPELRSNDRKLIWKIMEKEGIIMGDTIKYQKFLDGTAFESITRARRKVQENHPDLQATKQVQSYRKNIERQKGTHVYREYLL